MSVAVVAIIHPLPERRAEVVAAYEAAVADVGVGGGVISTVHAEDEGCELYAMHEDDDRLVLRPHPAGTDAQGVL